MGVKQPPSSLSPEAQEQWRMAFGDMKKSRVKKSRSNELTGEVIRYIKLKGGSARRVNTSGQWDSGTNSWRPSGMKKGFEDISCIVPKKINGKLYGVYLAIEIKIGADKISEYQVARKEEVEKAGGVYFVAKDFDSTKIIVDSLFDREDNPF